LVLRAPGAGVTNVNYALSVFLVHFSLVDNTHVHLLHGCLEQTLGRFIHLTVLANLGWPHIVVTAQRCTLKTRPLPLAGGLDAGANSTGWLPNRSLLSFS
jgi:hypothetical protein